ncbi:ABC transporter substrate-binding protein [Kaustia mangrovi]|uniref:ABC transporter substrate-binding protein n=1 Tax=Kaustia mangrovi TaxID=2593653 RepID=A0A7S8C190_9HYPH|nr:ABC transporter substrate-binding protein [Kaustia mangrovi]QPC41437.1 ABC transporter substrate-binding protein [Kaustia mangrovi]
MSGRLKRAAIASAALLALAAASPSAMADVKIGFLGGFTGPIEGLTPPILKGAELAVANVNDQGGILDGEKIEMPSGDTTCTDATAASNAADRMVNSEQVTAIVGALCSGATISSANNAGIPGGVVMVSPASTSPAVTNLKDNDLVFRTTPSDAYQGEAMAKLLRKKGVDEIAITYVNNDYGKGFADALDTAFTEAGGTVTAKEAHEEGKADYRAELGSLAASGAPMLAVLAYESGSGQTIVRQAIESGDFTDFIGGDGMVGENLISAVGAGNLEGMIATRAGKPEIPGADVFAKLAEKAGVDPSATYAPQAYDAAFLLALAVEKNGSADREGLNKALREVASAPGEVILPGEWEKAKKLIAEGKDINYEGAGGPLDFDQNGDVPGVIVELVVKDGKFVEVGRID